MSSAAITQERELPHTPICVSKTIPNHVKAAFGDPPSLDTVLDALEVLYDDFCFIYMSIAQLDYPGPLAADTGLANFVNVLYDFTYYRHCDSEAIAPFCESKEVDLSVDVCDFVELQIAATHLNRLLQSVRYQSFIKAGESGNDRDPLIDVIAHFVQLAYTQFRVEFGKEGYYHADADLLRRLRPKSESCEIFSNQEIEFISSCSATTISKEIKNGDKLVTVSSSDVHHWSRYSNIPDHVFPRKGNEVGSRQAFVTHESLQTWLAGRLNYIPTQFIHSDDGNKVPNYTLPTFFRDNYLPIKTQKRISDAEFGRACQLSEHHLRLLKSGKRPLFLRQANMIDNYLYGLGTTPFGVHQLFPLFNEFKC